MLTLYFDLNKYMTAYVASEALNQRNDAVRRVVFSIFWHPQDQAVLEKLLFEGRYVEIAKHCAERDGEITAQYIKAFGITDQRVLIEVAQLCAEIDYKKACDIFRYIGEFGLDERSRIELAKVLIKETFDVARNIKRFDIIDEKARIEIAKLYIQEIKIVPDDLLNTIKEFGITDQNALVEIAKLIVQKIPHMFDDIIKNFSITEENTFIEIAKTAIDRHQAVVDFTKKYNWISQRGRIEIAKHSAETMAGVTARCFKNFGITDEKARIEIAKLYLAKAGSTLWWWDNTNVKSFEIQDPHELAKLKCLWLFQQISEVPTEYERVENELYQLAQEKGPKDLLPLIEVAKANANPVRMFALLLSCLCHLSHFIDTQREMSCEDRLGFLNICMQNKDRATAVALAEKHLLFMSGAQKPEQKEEKKC